MKRLKKIDDVVAEGSWRFRKSDGAETSAKIVIGKPKQDGTDPNKDWYCPLFIEKYTKGIIPVMGVGPLDSLLNAMNLLRSFFEVMGISSGFAESKKKGARPTRHSTGRAKRRRAG